mgnify:FL=1
MSYTPDYGEADLMIVDPLTVPMAIAPGKLTYEASISAKWELASEK